MMNDQPRHRPLHPRRYWVFIDREFHSGYDTIDAAQTLARWERTARPRSHVVILDRHAPIMRKGVTTR